MRLSLRQGSPQQIAELVKSGEADIAIETEAEEFYEGLVLLPCYQWNRCVITPLGHPAARERQLTLEGIARHPLITYDFAFTGSSPIKRAFDVKGITPNVVLTAIDSDVIKTYVEMGLGVGILAKMAYDPARDTGLAPDRREPSVRAQHCAHRHPPQRLPARLRLRFHRAVRPASEARRGGGHAARRGHELRTVNCVIGDS